LELRIGNKNISNAVEITDKLNTQFICTVEELVKHKSNGSDYNLKINHCPNSIFICPVTEEEVISLIFTPIQNKTKLYFCIWNSLYY
jgi:hypothetical protein